MQYIKKLLTTLASMSYYSGSSDHLDDHLFPSYLEFVSSDALSANNAEAGRSEERGNDYLLGELVVVESECSEMNNSYPSH